MSKKTKQKICPICNEKLTFLKAILKDDVKVCSKHVVEEARLYLAEEIERSTVDDIKERIKQVSAVEKKIGNKIESFSKSKQIGNFVAFDEDKKQWAILSPFLGKISSVYDYDDITDFELIEDGSSVASGGLGRALVGGALFGGAGAIVGGVTGRKKKKEFCTSLKLKVTLNNVSSPVTYINFIETKTKKTGTVYKNIAEMAQECMSTFQIICDRQDREKLTENPPSGDVADEIMKFKNLLDAGAITQEEYETKKTELLRI